MPMSTPQGLPNGLPPGTAPYMQRPGPAMGPAQGIRQPVKPSAMNVNNFAQPSGQPQVNGHMSKPQQPNQLQGNMTPRQPMTLNMNNRPRAPSSSGPIRTVSPMQHGFPQGPQPVRPGTSTPPQQPMNGTRTPPHGQVVNQNLRPAGPAGPNSAPSSIRGSPTPTSRRYPLPANTSPLAQSASQPQIASQPAPINDQHQTNGHMSQPAPTPSLPTLPQAQTMQPPPTLQAPAATAGPPRRMRYPQMPPSTSLPQQPSPINGSVPSSTPAMAAAKAPSPTPTPMPNPMQPPAPAPSAGRYGQPTQQQPTVQQTQNLMGRLTVEQSNTYAVNLMEQRLSVFPSSPIERPVAPITAELQKRNPDPEVMNCTFNAIPQTPNLHKQCKLPFGIHIHPFKAMPDIPVIANSVITRCRSCRSYLNPFVSILDHRRWQCNVCFRVNDIPEELSYNPSTRQYIDVRKRPELNSATVEFIAPSEYMLRPPQPSVFLFVLDVSFNAINTGYLQVVCENILKNLDKLPGDSRSMIGFITFNSSVHFYSLKDERPQMMLVSDIEDMYIPVPDGLLVNIKEHKDTIVQLLETLPASLANETDMQSCTGAALTVARKMVSSTGGRITLLQTCLPSIGPGKLARREVSSMSTDSKDVAALNPATDFYKKLALECAGEQIAVDIFMLAGQYSDLASLSCVSRYSSGSIHYYPEFHSTKTPALVNKFASDFSRYLTRDVGFEAVMRLRCTKGLTIHSFHGNFFVRSTDLLSLPNVNPDHTFSVQISIEEALTDSSMVAFQAALLYTTTKGERRIRVHTLSLPVTTKISDVYAYADQQATVSLLSKMAVDRTLMSSLGDAREALMNACIDCLKTYRSEVSGQRTSNNVLSSYQLRILPLCILGLLKSNAFKLGSGVSLDQRFFSLQEFKWLPFEDAQLRVYPRLYSIADLMEQDEDADDDPPIMHASAEKLSRQGAYIMDAGSLIYLFVGRGISDTIAQELFSVPNFAALPENLVALPELNNTLNKKTRKFITALQKRKGLDAVFQIIREDSRSRVLFLYHLIDDRTESSMSYHEFLQHLQRQMNG